MPLKKNWNFISALTQCIHYRGLCDNFKLIWFAGWLLYNNMFITDTIPYIELINWHFWQFFVENLLKNMNVSESFILKSCEILRNCWSWRKKRRNRGWRNGKDSSPPSGESRVVWFMVHVLKEMLYINAATNTILLLLDNLMPWYSLLNNLVLVGLLLICY